MTMSLNTSHPTPRTISSRVGVLFFSLWVACCWVGYFWHRATASFSGIAGTTAYFTSLGMSPPEVWAWFAAIAELVLGTTLILGIATRYAALASFVWVLVATAMRIATGHIQRRNRLASITTG